MFLKAYLFQIIIIFFENLLEMIRYLTEANPCVHVLLINSDLNTFAFYMNDHKTDAGREGH